MPWKPWRGKFRGGFFVLQLPGLKEAQWGQGCEGGISVQPAVRNWYLDRAPHVWLEAIFHIPLVWNLAANLIALSSEPHPRQVVVPISDHIFCLVHFCISALLMALVLLFLLPIEIPCSVLCWGTPKEVAFKWGCNFGHMVTLHSQACEFVSKVPKVSLFILQWTNYSLLSGTWAWSWFLIVKSSWGRYVSLTQSAVTSICWKV